MSCLLDGATGVQSHLTPVSPPKTTLTVWVHESDQERTRIYKALESWRSDSDACKPIRTDWKDVALQRANAHNPNLRSDCNYKLRMAIHCINLPAIQKPITNQYEVNLFKAGSDTNVRGSSKRNLIAWTSTPATPIQRVSPNSSSSEALCVDSVASSNNWLDNFTLPSHMCAIKPIRHPAAWLQEISCVVALHKRLVQAIANDFHIACRVVLKVCSLR